MLNLISAHPLACGAALLALAWLLAGIAELAPRLFIACACAALRGPYRGQGASRLRGLAFLLTALAALCLPVFLLGVL